MKSNRRNRIWERKHHIWRRKHRRLKNEGIYTEKFENQTYIETDEDN
jgi:hypothetical protein